MRSILREPLLHFALVGLMLFAGAGAWRAAHDERRIDVTPERVAELSTKYRLQVGQPPTPAQLEAVIDRYVQEEELYREGRAMGLDKGDEVVRRRIAQKVQFLQQDRTLPPEPDLAHLHAFFKAHAADYATPVRTTFTHLYVSADGVGEGPARVRALRILGQLRTGDVPSQIDTDPFPDQSSYTAMSRPEAARLFGESELVRALDTAPVDAWSGPFRSGYGWHLVRVEARTAARAPEFADVRERVREDYLRLEQAKANARALAQLTSRYTVVRSYLESRP